VARAAAPSDDRREALARAGEAIPADPQARVEWLFDRWKVLDAWVAERTALREHLRSGD
jgi:hypothetical protein